MALIKFDKNNINSVNSAIIEIKAVLLSETVIQCLEDYYEGSGVEPRQEVNLRINLENDIKIVLYGLKG